jgi:hypothetical protein
MVSLKQRVRTGFRKGLNGILRQKDKTSKANSFTMTGTVSVLVGLHDVMKSAVVRFDSGCEYNLMSTRFAKKLGLPFDGSDRPAIGVNLSGGEVCFSLGTADCRWYAPECGRPAFKTSSFHVVDSELFDIIIGSETIESMGLFRPSRSLIGNYAHFRY